MLPAITFPPPARVSTHPPRRRRRSGCRPSGCRRSCCPWRRRRAEPHCGRSPGWSRLLRGRSSCSCTVLAELVLPLIRMSAPSSPDPPLPATTTRSCAVAPPILLPELPTIEIPLSPLPSKPPPAGFHPIQSCSMTLPAPSLSTIPFPEKPVTAIPRTVLWPELMLRPSQASHSLPSSCTSGEPAYPGSVVPSISTGSRDCRQLRVRLDRLHFGSRDVELDLVRTAVARLRVDGCDRIPEAAVIDVAGAVVGVLRGGDRERRPWLDSGRTGTRRRRRRARTRR